MEAAERAVNRHYARPTAYQRLDRLSQAARLDSLTRRRLERLRLAYQSKQAPVEILDWITRAEADIQETYSTFRAQFDGRSVTDNELEDVLRTTRDNAARQSGLGSAQADRSGRRGRLAPARALAQRGGSGQWLQ